MKPQFSVIIPTYNRQAFIAEAIESALKQTYPATEVIVYDDGSTDDTESIVERYINQIKYIKFRNAGVVMARKNAIAMASGDWIALLDSDDIWRKNYLKDVVTCINEFPVAELVGTNFCNIDNTGTKFFDQFASAPHGWWPSVVENQKDHYTLLKANCYLYFLKYQPIYVSAMVFSRELYNSIGGINPHVSHLLAEDAHLTRRLVATGRVACNTEKNVFIRKHDSNISANMMQNFADRIKILELLLEEGDVPQPYQHETKNTITQWRLELFNKLFEHSRYWDMQAVYKLLPPELLTTKVRCKYWISHLGRIMTRKPRILL